LFGRQFAFNRRTVSLSIASAIKNRPLRIRSDGSRASKQQSQQQQQQQQPNVGRIKRQETLAAGKFQTFLNPSKNRFKMPSRVKAIPGRAQENIAFDTITRVTARFV